MKAPAFQYARPNSVEEVCSLLATHEDAQILAGGQSLVAAMNMRLASPAVLIDINKIKGLSDIHVEKSDSLVIGATVRHVQIQTSPLVAQRAPLLTKAMGYVAHPSIQNRGTHCGSLAFADPAVEMPACALVLSAQLELQSTQGRRMVDAEDFVLGVYETACQPNEFLIAAHYPMTYNRRFGFGEIAPRHGDFAKVGLALNVESEAGKWRDLRLVVFSCEPMPRLLTDVAALAEGQTPSASLFAALADAVAASIMPMDHENVRRHQARGLALQVFERAL